MYSAINATARSPRSNASQSKGIGAIVENNSPTPWVRPFHNSLAGFILIHGHILAAIIEGGLLAFFLHWIATSTQIEAETRKRKAELIPKVIHDGQASISVLASFRKSYLWLKQHPNPADRDNEIGRSRDEKLRLYDDLYKLYVQQPKIEGICKDVQMVYTTEKVRKKAQQLEQIVLTKLFSKDEKVEKDEKYEKAIEKIVDEELTPVFNELVKLMDEEVNQR